MNERESWERFFREALGLPFVFGFAAMDAPGFDLSPAERALYDAFGRTPRREIWWRGRSALKTVLGQLGEDSNTAAIAFPHPRLSLTHSGSAAVAVGIKAGLPIKGIGVDLEQHRTPAEAITRFFLSDRESSWLETVPASERNLTLLRLWTAKEAVFKADADNSGRILTDYRLEDPAQPIARARRGASIFEYGSLAIPDGMLSVAVNRLQLEEIVR